MPPPAKIPDNAVGVSGVTVQNGVAAAAGNLLRLARISRYIRAMDKDAIIAGLSGHRAGLQQLGAVPASLFGGTARGDNSRASGVDIAVKLDPARTPHGLDYAGYVDAIQERLEAPLEKEVDAVPEPANKGRLQEQIDKDRAIAF